MNKIIQIQADDLQEIEGNRCRIFQAVSEPLTAQRVLNDIAHYHRRRVIIICNTVAQAQGLFRELDELNQNSRLMITLLHSRFLPEDRAKKEAYLKQTFALNWQHLEDKTCHLLIATQVIEAGLNITCEVMHTHLCPMNSLLQRAGRCARFGGETGAVYLYRSFQVTPLDQDWAMADLDDEPETKTPKQQRFLPYNRDICELTWTVLQAHTESEQGSQSVGFGLEEQWINQVHSLETQRQQERRANNQMHFEQHLNAALFQGEASAAAELIRWVDARSVFVWSEPIFFDDEPIDPQQLLAFSMPISSLCQVWQAVKNLGYEIDWMFKSIRYIST